MRGGGRADSLGHSRRMASGMDGFQGLPGYMFSDVPTCDVEESRVKAGSLKGASSV